METTIVQDKDNEDYLFVAVEADKPYTLLSEMLTPARIALEDWGQENGYGSIIPYFESLAGGTETLTVFHVSFVSFTKPEK